MRECTATYHVELWVASVYDLPVVDDHDFDADAENTLERANIVLKSMGSETCRCPFTNVSAYNFDKTITLPKCCLQAFTFLCPYQIGNGSADYLLIADVT